MLVNSCIKYADNFRFQDFEVFRIHNCSGNLHSLPYSPSQDHFTTMIFKMLITSQFRTVQDFTSTLNFFEIQELLEKLKPQASLAPNQTIFYKKICVLFIPVFATQVQLNVLYILQVVHETVFLHKALLNKSSKNLHEEYSSYLPPFHTRRAEHRINYSHDDCVIPPQGLFEAIILINNFDIEIISKIRLKGSGPYQLRF